MDEILPSILGIMSFTGARISEIFFGNVNLAIVECSRFLGSAVLMLSYFLHTPHQHGGYS
jgi:hypothetical protein